MILESSIKSPKIKKGKEQKRVYDEIKTAIFSEKFYPGEKLTLKKLSDLVHSSTSTVILVLSMLEKEGLVTQTDYKGYEVKKIMRREAIEILDTRMVLEAYVGNLCCVNIDDEHFKELKEKILKMEECIKKEEFEEYSNTNAAFHNILYKMAGNETLWETIKNLKERMTRLQIRTSYLPGRAEQSLQEHKKIYDALCEKDSSMVEEALIEHITNIKNAIIKNEKLLGTITP